MNYEESCHKIFSAFQNKETRRKSIAKLQPCLQRRDNANMFNYLGD